MIGSTEFLSYTGATDVAYPLGTLGRSPRQVLDVGAGAGSGTLHLLARCPDAAVVCLEPDDAARNALLWRLAEHPDRERVTVLPLTLAGARALGGALGRFGLVTGHHVTCQIPLRERGAFWSDVRTVLTESGCALVDSHMGQTSTEPVARRKSAQGRNGECTVTRWFTLEAHDSAMRARNEYELTDHQGHVLWRDERVEDLEVVDERLARQQIADAGFRVTDVDEHWLLLSPRS